MQRDKRAAAPVIALILMLGGSAPAHAGYCYSGYMAYLKPVAWWRLSETGAATTAVDSSGNGHDGTYVNTPTLGTAGSVTQDPSTSITLSAASSQYIEVADADDLSLVKGQDAFGRTVGVSNSWGTAEVGGSWTAAFTTNNYYSCNGSTAQIDQTGGTGTWGQTLGVSRKDVDLQIKASWNQVAAGAAIIPVALMARYASSTNYYRAEIRENVGGSLDLRVVKVVGGTSTVIQTASAIGTYVTGDSWYLRFQVEGSALRASAWKDGTPLSPWAWTINTSDTALVAAGTVGIRSTNSGSTARPTVSFDDFRVQSVGMTIHGWIRPTALDFTGDTSEDYIHWLSKGAVNSEQEYACRFYPISSTRPNRLSAYLFNTSGGLGAGAYFQESLTSGQWIHIVAVYDPGDLMDDSAGVTIYRDGTLKQGPGTSSATKYSHPSYLITPSNGTGVLRIGASQLSSTWTYFTGGIDEVAIFDRKLTSTEIANLHSYAQ